jgi:hypothetical protein
LCNGQTTFVGNGEYTKRKKSDGKAKEGEEKEMKEIGNLSLRYKLPPPLTQGQIIPALLLFLTQ